MWKHGWHLYICKKLYWMEMYRKCCFIDEPCDFVERCDYVLIEFCSERDNLSFQLWYVQIKVTQHNTTAVWHEKHLSSIYPISLGLNLTEVSLIHALSHKPVNNWSEGGKRVWFLVLLNKEADRTFVFTSLLQFWK